MKNKEGKKSEKQLLRYIDKSLSKGHSLSSIRKTLVKRGCDSSLANHLIDTYRQTIHVPGSLLIVLFIVILMLSWNMGID